MRVLTGGLFRVLLNTALLIGYLLLLQAQGAPFPPFYNDGVGPAVHYKPVAWPNEPTNPLSCSENCGDWKPYTRFQNNLNDPRNRDLSNGGTSPQSYVNISSSCADTSQPSIYYYLKEGNTAAEDVLMFRWRVAAAPHNYATGPSAGNFSSGNPWSSALWTVLFDLNGNGYTDLAAHIDGSSGSPATPVDMLVGIWSNVNSHSIDYITDPNIHQLGHNPTAFIGPTSKILNFRNALNPTETWPNGSAETVWDYGTTRATLVSKNSCTEYFIDYQIPVAMLDASALGGPKISRDTPISMLFCTANSLNNPFQKDCALNSSWTANANTPGPFGDYISFNQQASYSQPIISNVSATPPQSCPASYQLEATVQDTLAVINGQVVTSVQSVQFYYWYDRNGNGLADEQDSAWILVPQAGALKSGSLNIWQSAWDATALPKGKYLIGVQALDDNSRLDTGMTPSGINNRTFSYLSGDNTGQIYIAGSWINNQQNEFPLHNPGQQPINSENWFGNPAVTGQQLAIIGTAINACGVAPGFTLAADKTQLSPAETSTLTLTLSNPANNSAAIAVTEFTMALPAGFSYIANSAVSNTLTFASVTESAGNLVIQFAPGTALAVGSSAAVSFDVTAATTAGNYTFSANAVTDFATVPANSLSVAVDGPRLGLNLVPDSLSITANGSSQVIVTANYSNQSLLALVDGSLEITVPAGVTVVSCGVCTQTNGQLSWDLGALAAGATGAVTFSFSLPDTWATPSVSFSGTLSASTTANSPVSLSANRAISVSGYAVVGEPLLTLQQTASAAIVDPGATYTITFAYANQGSATAGNVVINQAAPPGVSFVSASNGATIAAGGQSVSWTIGNVAAGASGSRTLTVLASSPFIAANPIIHQGVLSFGSPSQQVNANEVSIGVTGQACSNYYFRNTQGNVGFDGQRRLATLSPVPVASDVGSSVTVTATGTYSEALRFYQDPASITDVPFNGNLTTTLFYDRANGSGLNIRTTVFDYNSVTGARVQLGQSITSPGGNVKGELTTTTALSGTLNKDHRLLWVYEVQTQNANQTAQIQFQFNGTVTNAISGGSTYALAKAAYCVTPPANFNFSVINNKPLLAATGTEQVVYTLNFANVGNTAANNSQLTATLPTGFTNCQVSTDNSNWNNCSSSASHTFSLGNLNGGSSGIRYLRAEAPNNRAAGENFAASFSLVSDQTSAITRQSVSAVQAASNVVAVPELTLALAASKTQLIPGDTVTITLDALNIGSAATANATLTAILPAVSFLSLQACAGCTVNGNQLTWNLGAVGVAQSLQRQVQLAVTNTGLTAGISLAELNASVTDTLTSANVQPVTLTLSGNPQLTLTLSAAPNTGLNPASNVNVSAVVTNIGNLSAQQLNIAVPMPNGVSFNGGLQSSVAGAVFDPLQNQVLLPVAQLAAGSSVTLAFAAQVGSLPAGNTSLTLTAEAFANNALKVADSVILNASAQVVMQLQQNTDFAGLMPVATVAESANSNQLRVLTGHNLLVGHLVRINNQAVRVIQVSGNVISLSAIVSANINDPVLPAIVLDINYFNAGNAVLSSGQLATEIPQGLSFYSTSVVPDNSVAVGSAGTVSWNITQLAPNQGQVIQLTLFPEAASGVYPVISTLSGADISNSVVQTDLAFGGVQVAKATSTPVILGTDQARYTITLTNTLAAAVSGLQVTDLLPENFAYVMGSATVGGTAVEPDLSEAGRISWSGLTVSGNSTLAISFELAPEPAAAALTLQNEVSVTGPSNVKLLQFDALATTAEDVTLLGATESALSGKLYFSAAGNAVFNLNQDQPLQDVEVRIYQQQSDCNNLFSPNCVLTQTDGNGDFSAILPAGTWTVEFVSATGDLNAGWQVISGNNPRIFNLVAGQTALADTGFTTPAGTVTLTYNASAGGTLSGVTQQVVAAGADGSAVTAVPDTGYQFTAWSDTVTANPRQDSAVSSDLNVTANFSLISYTVEFKDFDGTALKTETVNHGAAATAPADPTRAGYTFSGWNPAVFSSITADQTITAQYNVNSYTLTFNSNGGSGIAPINANFGSAVTAPTNPTREGYTFAGWSPAVPTTMPASDITITAQWELNIYTVRYLDWDDTVLHVLHIPHGEAAVLPLLPERVGFRFIGWSQALDRIAGNVDVRALYEELSYEVSVVISGAATVTPEQQVVLYGRQARFAVNLSNADDVVVVNSGCGASYQAGEITTAPIFAACSIAVTVYDPVQVEADMTAPGPINQIRRFTVFGGSGNQRLLEADITRAGRAVPMTEDEIKTVLTRLDDGSYRFTASRTGRYSFRFVDAASGQVVEISFDILPYLAFTSSQQQLEPGQSSSVTVWLSDEAIDYPVRANLMLEQVMLSATAVILREEDTLRKTYTLSAVTQSGSVTISQQGVANVLVGTPERHRVLVVDEPAPLSLFGEATQQARVTTVVSRRNGIVQLSARENSAVPVSFSWSANGLPLQAEGEWASFDPRNVALGAYTVTISATDGRRNGRYELLLRVIDACNFDSCDTTTGIPAAINPLHDSTNRLPLCPIVDSTANRVERCQQQGLVFAEVPNLYTLSLGLFSGDVSWQTEQFGLALNDGSLQDAGFTQVGYTVNLDILALPVPGESVPVMIPLPAGTTIPKDAVWRKFTNMQWHNFVEDADNVVQSAARDALGQCPVVSSDVWEEGLVEGYGCIRLIIEDGGPNDDDALANGVIRDPGVLAVRNSYTLTFNSNGGSTVVPVTQVFGSALNIVPPVREGHTFVGWSPALPETMPSESVTYTAQWQVNAYQIRFDTAGGQTLAPLTVNFGRPIVAPVPVRQGYTFKGWNPILPATMPAGDIQVTAQWYESSVEVTSKGGSMHALWLVGLGLLAWLRKSRLGLVWLAVLLPATAQSSAWFVEASVGNGRSQSSDAALNQQLNTVLRGDAEIIKNRDTAYRVTLGYQLTEDWYLEAGWTELGKLVVAYANLPEGTTNRALLAVQPQRGHGVEIASRYYVVSGERYQGYLRAGYLINRERYKFEWPRGTELEYNPEANWVLGKGRDQNLVFGAGMDYRLNDTLALGLSWQQYDTERAKTRLVLLNLQYRF